MDKQEKIVCAAMFVKWKYKDLDFKNEEVICGVDHNLIRKSPHFMDRRYNYDREYFSFEKGFITSKNRFVDAKEAMEIAIEQDQILEINNCFAEFHEAQLSENFRKVNTLLGELQSLKLKHASRELKPGDLY